MPVPLEVARFKFTYKDVFLMLDHRSASTMDKVVRDYKTCFDFLQLTIQMYDELEKERDTLTAENRLLKEM